MFLILFYLNLIFNTSAVDHAFHISRTEVNYNTEAGEIQIAAHIYLDDLEADLAREGQKDLHLCTPKESKSADGFLDRYVQKNLLVKINGKLVQVKMIGKETSKDLLAVWCYFEATEVYNGHSIEIKNSILTGLYSDQKNLLSFSINNKRKAYWSFDAEAVVETLSF